MKGKIMDATKWKSIAVRAGNYALLKGLCLEKKRTPGLFVEKLIEDYINYQAKKEEMSLDKYKQSLLDKLDG